MSASREGHADQTSRLTRLEVSRLERISQGLRPVAGVDRGLVLWYPHGVGALPATTRCLWRDVRGPPRFGCRVMRRRFCADTRATGGRSWKRGGARTRCPDD
jgi:hypothetical protein